MKYRIIISICAVSVLFAATAIVSCTQDTEAEGGNYRPETKTRFTVTVAAPERPQTRAMDMFDEAEIKTIDLLVFDDSDILTEMKKIPKSDITQDTSEATNYKYTFAVALQDNPSAKTVSIVANASARVDAAIAAAGATKNKVNILNNLTVTTSGKWYDPGTPGNDPAIPMYGEMPVSGIALGMTITPFELTRMIAGIDLINKAGNITVNKVYLVNYNTAGYVASMGGDVSANENPVLPASSGKQVGKAKAQAFDPVVNPTTLQQEVKGGIYTFEALKAFGTDTGAGHKEAICLILEGTYQSKTYFYRLDFTSPRDSSGKLPGEAGYVAPRPENVQYMPVYRNHKYTFEIIKAEGIGYTDFDEALGSYGVMSNLKTRLHVIDQTQYKDMVYNGQYFLGVESKDIDIVWGMGKTVNLPVSTDFPGSWNAQMLDAGTQTWLRFAGNQTEIGGTSLGEASTLTFQANALPSFSTPSARILLSAGRLQITITVNRVSVTSLFARSNVVLRTDSGSPRLSFAVTENDNLTTMPANSQGVFFKWGSLIALSPVGNPYEATKHAAFNPTIQLPGSWGNGMQGWDNIPYAHAKFGFPASTVFNDKFHDEFSGYGASGYNVSAGIGDVCRYISASDGKEPWVEGKWRMPTEGDYWMLLQETTKVAKGGSFTNETAAVAETQPNASGMFKPASGWWFGEKVSSATLGAEQMAVPPEGTLFMPSSGHRYPNGDGAVVHVGAYGYYWTGTPYDNITVNYPHQNKYGTEEYDADRSYAFPVRCIRDN